jgi:hypothetical protein
MEQRIFMKYKNEGIEVDTPFFKTINNGIIQIFLLF